MRGQDRSTERAGSGRLLAAAGLTAALLTAFALAPGSPAGAHEWSARVSLDAAGGDPDSASGSPVISADGSTVAFTSVSSDLVAGDANGLWDVFVRDLDAGTTTRVSVDTGGGDPDASSGAPAISADGDVVAFASLASDLVPGDTNDDWDVFVRDLDVGTTTLVTPDRFGADANGDSLWPAISADGSTVAFASEASDLLAGDTNGLWDVFVRDLDTSTTVRGSVDSGAGNANGSSYFPALSADGRTVAFESSATDMVPDTNGAVDVFVRDLDTNTTVRASVDTASGSANGPSRAPAISADGRHVAFESVASDLAAGDANGLVDVFVRDLDAATTTRVSVDATGGDSNGGSNLPAIGADGRTVAFTSAASDVVPGDTNRLTDVFVRDLDTATTILASLDPAGGGANDESGRPTISGDAGRVAFASLASDLVPGDANDERDVFVARARLHLVPAGRVTVNGTYTPVPGDFDGDGRVDVLWYAPGTRADSLWRSTASGFTPVRITNVLRTYTPIPGDFDGDGRTDIYWYGPGTAPDGLWRGTTTGFTSAAAPLVNGTFRPAAGDYDGDGRTDILWHAPGATADRLWRGTTGGFTSVPVTNVNGQYTPVAGDYDGDGRDDVFFYAPGAASDAHWRGTATGFTPGPARSVSGTYTPIAGDSEGDGPDDLLWYAPGAAVDRTWRGGAAGLVDSHGPQVTGTFTPVPGDFTGDGRTDVLWYAPGVAHDEVWHGQA